VHVFNLPRPAMLELLSESNGTSQISVRSEKKSFSLTNWAGRVKVAVRRTSPAFWYVGGRKEILDGGNHG
jgi:hypothetical protein